MAVTTFFPICSRSESFDVGSQVVFFRRRRRGGLAEVGDGVLDGFVEEEEGVEGVAGEFGFDDLVVVVDVGEAAVFGALEEEGEGGELLGGERKVDLEAAGDVGVAADVDGGELAAAGGGFGGEGAEQRGDVAAGLAPVCCEHDDPKGVVLFAFGLAQNRFGELDGRVEDADQVVPRERRRRQDHEEKAQNAQVETQGDEIFGARQAQEQRHLPVQEDAK
mmetsp:Transcript_28662/g.87754  ORF Transcript_28662/g.87754 Transcript_28662/m.87754 type:complete len:220 (-) Transcript_28662:303-962(-)